MSCKSHRAREMQAIVLGLLLITSSGLTTGAGASLNGLPFANGIPAGQTFFLALAGQSSGPNAAAGTSDPGIPVVMQTVSALQSQTGGDFLFVRQGSAYLVFPLSEEPTQYPLLAQMPQLWSDSRRKRSRFRTHVEILELLRGGPLSAFEVAFHLRLNSKRTREYLEFLEEQGLVERESGEKAPYRITPEGMVLAERARALLFLEN